jgi:hypothetical protein
MRTLINHEENGYLARAAALRQELRELRQERQVEVPAKEKEKAPTQEKEPVRDKKPERSYRPRGQRQREIDERIKAQDEKAKAKEAELRAKMTPEQLQKEKDRHLQLQKDLDRER